MGPRKRKADVEGIDVKEEAVADEKKETGVGRVTRSSTRLAGKGSVAVKEKGEVVKKAKTVEEKEEEVNDEVKKEEEEVKDEVEKEEIVEGKEMKTIVIEHCKQCNAFKTRAIQVKEGLEKAFDGIQVLINPEKPRRGCFEIREQGGEPFLTLLDMKRPFPPLKALNMEKVVSDIIEKLK